MGQKPKVVDIIEKSFKSKCQKRTQKCSSCRYHNCQLSNSEKKLNKNLPNKFEHECPYDDCQIIDCEACYWIKMQRNANAVNIKISRTGKLPKRSEVDRILNKLLPNIKVLIENHLKDNENDSVKTENDINLLISSFASNIWSIEPQKIPFESHDQEMKDTENKMEVSTKVSKSNSIAANLGLEEPKIMETQSMVDVLPINVNCIPFNADNKDQFLMTNDNYNISLSNHMGCEIKTSTNNEIHQNGIRTTVADSYLSDSESLETSTMKDLISFIEDVNNEILIEFLQ
ncbi:hypothetical protein PVAND_008355 [Polypedilum vanderplanki]|uniref:Uncharacterized protein n=1 Tax=Polypedilum vanderplanki TaxID=319348 RepID=A0A9J6CAC1_POLVA|nr:hypothetical protein PVAND_008355 [Polypedilum vanderplanki]